MKNKYLQNQGFTLIEIMISMVIAGFLISAMYSVYTIQSRSYTVQDQVSEMQQKIRAAMDMMTREMRMAGHDPGNSCGARIITAVPEEMAFDMCDIDGEDYTITFKLNNRNLDLTRDLDRDNDDETAYPIAEDVDALEFLYLDEDDAVAASTSAIRSVKISMLVRASYPDRKYTNTTLYEPESVRRAGAGVWPINGGANPANDNYHRRLLITSIQLRNMGL